MQRTQHVSKNEKLLSLLQRLQIFYYEHENDILMQLYKEKKIILKIDRKHVDSIVRDALDITDRHTIYSWIDLLVSEEYLILFRISSNHVKEDTLYYVGIFEIENRINQLQMKLHPINKLSNFMSTKVESQNKVDQPPTHAIDSTVQTSALDLSRTTEASLGSLKEPASKSAV